MYKVVDKCASFSKYCFTFSVESNFLEIVKKCCFRGADTLCGLVGEAKENSYKRVCMRSIRTCDTALVIVVSKTILANSSEKSIDVLVPTIAKNKHSGVIQESLCFEIGVTLSRNWLSIVLSMVYSLIGFGLYDFFKYFKVHLFYVDL